VLVLALSATLVGFVLLVAALLTGVLWLAIACVVVCVIGVGFLIGDLLGLGRSSSTPTDSDANDPDRTAAAGGADSGTGDSDLNDEVGTSDQEQAGDWSATAEHEEDPTTGDSSEGHTRNGGHFDAASEADTGEIPRISKHDRPDDPPTEEFFLDKPR
jgi:hypothetical protein